MFLFDVDVCVCVGVLVLVGDCVPVLALSLL